MNAEYSKTLKVIAFILLILISVQLTQAQSQGILNWIYEKVGYIFQFFIDLLVGLLNQILRPFFDLMQDSLLTDPSLYPLKDKNGILTTNGAIMRDFMLVLVPLYVFSVMTAGAYLVFMSHSPSGRAQAKMIFDKLLVGMIMVPLSPALYEVLLKTNNILTRSVIHIITSGITQGNSIGDSFYSAISQTPVGAKIVYVLVFGTILWSALLALLTMYFRYLCVLAMGFIFPFTLFLYLHDWTKQMGTRLIRFTLIWIYAPAIMAVWLSIGVATVASAGARGGISGATTPCFLIASLLMVFATPLVMSGVMRWLGGIVSAVGMVVPGPYGVALAAAGGLMQGKGVGAITSAGLKIGVNKMWGASNKLLSKARGGSTSRLTGGTGGGGSNPLAKATEGPKAGAGNLPSSSPTPGGGGKGGGDTGAKGGKVAGTAGKNAGKVAGGAAGQTAGQGLGTTAGAAVGSVVPGAGTAAGAKAGGQIGGQAGRQVGKQVGGQVGGSVGRAAGRAWGAVKGAVKGGAKAAWQNKLKPWAALSTLKGAAQGAYSGVTNGRALGGDLKAVAKKGLNKAAGVAEKGWDKVMGNRPGASVTSKRAADGSTSRFSGGAQKGNIAPGQQREREPVDKDARLAKMLGMERKDQLHDFKAQLASPDKRPHDPWRGVGETLDGMDTGE